MKTKKWFNCSVIIQPGPYLVTDHHDSSEQIFSQKFPVNPSVWGPVRIRVIFSLDLEMGLLKK